MHAQHKQHAGPVLEETLTTAYSLDTNLLSAAERRLFTMNCASTGSMSGLEKGSGSHALPPLPLRAPNSQAPPVSTGPAQHAVLLCGVYTPRSRGTTCCLVVTAHLFEAHRAMHMVARGLGMSFSCCQPAVDISAGSCSRRLRLQAGRCTRRVGRM